MKAFLVLMLFFSAIKTTAQEFIDTMYFDKFWEQTTADKAQYFRIINFNPEGDFMFHVSDLYLSGQVQMTGNYRSIRPDYREGTFIWYYENGLKQQECNYKNNQLNGSFTEWYDNGQIKTRQNFYENLPDASYKTWRKDGTIMVDAQYMRGEKHGYFMTYYENGQIKRKELYDNGVFIEGQCFDINGEEAEYFPYIVMPVYKGGPSALKKYIQKELKYPRQAIRENKEAIILVIFTIGVDGKVIDPQIVHGDEEYFNKESLRLINSFSLWIPGKVDGEVSPLQVSLPIEFRLP